MSKITLVGGPADGRTFTPSSEQRYKGKLIYLNATKPNQQEQVYSRTSLSDDFWIHQGSVDDVAEKQQYEARKHYETQAELAAKSKTITKASDFLSEGLRILSERGKQYDPIGTKEMSFDNVAEAFNCLTNSRLKGSDVCLLLALLKVVRQNANKDFHEDSAVDFVNYAALHSELVSGEKA